MVRAGCRLTRPLPPPRPDLKAAYSFYNVATTNELWAAYEVIIDALSFVVMAPAVRKKMCTT